MLHCNPNILTMKHLILIPTLLFSLAVAGQSKVDSTNVAKSGVSHQTNKPTLFIGDPDTPTRVVMSGTLATNFIVKYDTVKCWFKELVIDTNGYLTIHDSTLVTVKDTSLTERWQKGFKVRIEYPGSEMDSGFAYGVYRPSANMVTDHYLYSDRKTVVKNQIIYSIER